MFFELRKNPVVAKELGCEWVYVRSALTLVLKPQIYSSAIDPPGGRLNTK